MAEPALTTDVLERRRLERRTNARLGDVTLPELRRMIITSVLFVVVLALFVWMVRTVIIAGFLGVVVAIFLRPAYRWLLARIGSVTVAAVLTVFLLVAPVVALSVYSYAEISDAATYVDQHESEIVARINGSTQRIPFLRNTRLTKVAGDWVVIASNYGSRIPAQLRAAAKQLGIAITIFLFTTYYLLVDWARVTEYIARKVPPRYSQLGDALQHNARGVLYGAVYSTFFTQILKTAIIFAMNIAFHVPLAAVLALLSFVIGFFPIVGSWSIYVPVAGWLAVFRNAPGQALAMLLIGFFVNTVYISTILRPRIAAQRSRVLNFYWMLVALVTGVYTFGLVGILLGPVLIGLLKAILDTITESSIEQFADPGGDDPRPQASTLGP